MDEQFTEDEVLDILEQAYPFDLVFGEDSKIVGQLLQGMSSISESVQTGNILILRDYENNELMIFKEKYTLPLDRLPEKLRKKLEFKDKEE